jgi:hypothetical protein
MWRSKSDYSQCPFVHISDDDLDVADLTHTKTAFGTQVTFIDDHGNYISMDTQPTPVWSA